MAADEKHLLIARKNGSSSSRRQRGFEGAARTVAAIKRWEAEGFNGFWVYGPRTACCPPCADGEHADDGIDPICPCCGQDASRPAVAERPLIGEWHGDPAARESVLTTLER